MSTKLDYSQILQVGLGFWPARTLLSAVELELFTALGKRSMTGKEIGEALGLHPRGIWDFLDGLVAMGFLGREGNGNEAKYLNTAQTAMFLDKSSPEYIGGVLEMASNRLYRYWGNLTEALRTGQPQNEIKYDEKNIFDVLYQDPVRLEEFMKAMTGFSKSNFQSFAEKFNFSKYQTLCDIGGAMGLLSILVAKAHPHMRCVTYDLPAVEPIARKTIEESGLTDQISTASGNFFKDPLPKADVITMGMILHDWNLENKKWLIKAAYEALPDGGALVAIENIIDDARRENVFGLMMSLNMLIEFGDAFDFTGADFTEWCTEIGFKSTEILPLGGPASAAVAYK